MVTFIRGLLHRQLGYGDNNMNAVIDRIKSCRIEELIHTDVYTGSGKSNPNTIISYTLPGNPLPDNYNHENMQDLCTPLHIACYYGHTNAVIEILERLTSDQIVITNRQGNTPLHFAAFRNETEIARMLLEKMDRWTKNKRQELAIDLVQEDAKAMEEMLKVYTKNANG